MGRRKKQPKICVFMLTYNRPEYVERSIESLYKRAGYNFDLYVFDDVSDIKTQRLLKRLKKEYKFKLYINDEHLNIYKNFYTNISKIPVTYDYYIKLDSDVEILTDDLFKFALDNFALTNVVGLTPRVEGIMNSDRYDSVIEFFDGHTVKLKAPIVYGCCLIFTSTVFNSFKRKKEKELSEINEKWGIDTILYDHALTLGKFLIVEDLSVYHIDNTYGQRRKYTDYYTERMRWQNIDERDIWFIKASKMIAPRFIQREDYLRIKQNSINFDDFINNCKIFLNERLAESNKNNIDDTDIEIIQALEKMKISRKKEPVKLKMMYKISSPINFRPDPNISHCSIKLYSDIPKWAINNPRIVVEKIEIEQINN